MKESAGRILMLLENPFPTDTRVRNEAYTLQSSNYRVTIICLAEKGEKFTELLHGVRVYRIPKLTLFRKTKIDKSSRLRRAFTILKSALGYAGEYFYFTTACLVLSLYVFFKDGFDVIHAHNPPDTLCLVGGIYKLFGKKFIFDHHDLSPELYLSRFRIHNNLILSGLRILEKLSLVLSDAVIATNESYKLIEVERGNLDADKIFVVRNGPDLQRLGLVSPDQTLTSMGKTILLYVGEMNPQDGVDYLLRALEYLVHKLDRTDFYCLLVGKGDSLEDLRSLAVELNLNGYVRFAGWVSEEDLVRYLSTADIGLDPNPSSPLNDHSTWIKVMEYMAMGKPLVCFDLKETRFTAQRSALYATPNDEAEFAEAIVKLMDNPQLRRQLGQYGRERIESDLAWEKVSNNLLLAYRSLQV